MTKALKDASLLPRRVNVPDNHTEDIWSVCAAYTPCAFCLKECSKACFPLGIISLLVLNANSCPCGIAASPKGSVSLWWLGFGCKVPVVICARCRRKNPNPCVYVCVKTQFNLEARERNVNGLRVAAAPSAMWCGRPPSPRRHKQARLRFCWNVAKPSAK